MSALTLSIVYLIIRHLRDCRMVICIQRFSMNKAKIWCTIYCGIKKQSFIEGTVPPGRFTHSMTQGTEVSLNLSSLYELPFECA